MFYLFSKWRLSFVYIPKKIITEIKKKTKQKNVYFKNDLLKVEKKKPVNYILLNSLSFFYVFFLCVYDFCL